MKLNTLKKEFNWLMLEAIQRSGVTRERLPAPCEILFIFHYKNKACLRDLDGNYPNVKFAIDSLVELGLLEDDSIEYVKRIIFETGEQKGNVFDMVISSLKN